MVDWFFAKAGSRVATPSDWLYENTIFFSVLPDPQDISSVEKAHAIRRACLNKLVVVLKR